MSNNSAPHGGRLILTVASKELRQISRDPAGLFVGTMLPAIFLAILAGILFSTAMREPARIASQRYKLGATEEDYRLFLESAWRQFQLTEYSTATIEQLNEAAALRFGFSLAESLTQTCPVQSVHDPQTLKSWSDWVFECYRIYLNRVGAAPDSTLHEPDSPLVLVVLATGGVEHREFIAIEDDPLDLQVSKLIDDSTADVIIRARQFLGKPTLPGSQTLIDWEIYYDFEAMRSVGAAHRIEPLLRSNDLPDVKPAGMDTTSALLIDVGRSPGMPKKTYILIGFLAAYTTVSLYLLIVRITFTYASELGLQERLSQTLEPLFLTRASRFGIMLGKYLAINIAAMLVSVYLIACFAFVFFLMLPSSLLPQNGFLDATLAGGLLLVVIAPIVISASAVALAVAIASPSARTANSYLSVAMVVLVSPGIACFVTGFKPSALSSLVPMVGTSLCMRSLIIGDFNWGYFAASMLSSVLLAAPSLIVVAMLCQRETLLYEQ